jgi:hypothetical protein
VALVRHGNITLAHYAKRLIMIITNWVMMTSTLEAMRFFTGAKLGNECARAYILTSQGFFWGGSPPFVIQKVRQGAL